MKFDLTKPCDQCPFRRGTPIRLTEARVHEIASTMLSAQGGTFPCHKTIDYDKFEDDGDLDPHASHCVGALVFAEKHRNRTQYMRIAERLGFYDHSKLVTKANKKHVFDTLKQMLAEVGTFRKGRHNGAGKSLSRAPNRAVKLRRTGAHARRPARAPLGQGPCS
jgi:hypothetical protein